MNKKIKKGLSCVVTLLALSVLLIGCPDPAGNRDGNEVIDKFFAGSFAGGSGKVELFVQGLPLTSQRSLARSLIEGSELIAHIEHNNLKLRLEGVYDPKSDGFVLSARTEDYTYAIFGQLSYDGDFDFAEITVTERKGEGWDMKSTMIAPDPSVNLSRDGFSTGLAGVPSGLSGHNEYYLPWFAEDDNFREWVMVSPAAMAKYEFDPEKGYPEEIDRMTFVYFEPVPGNPNAMDVVFAENMPTEESWMNAFYPGGAAYTDRFGNDNPMDTMYSEALGLGLKMGSSSSLWEYYKDHVLPVRGQAYVEQHKAALAKAFSERTYNDFFGWYSDVEWPAPEIWKAELWEEYADTMDANASDPYHYLYNANWDRNAYLAEGKAKGEIFTVDNVTYRIHWSWDFTDCYIWAKAFTKTDWENLNAAANMVFPNYIWQYRRDLLSNALWEEYAIKHGVKYVPLYYKARVERNSYNRVGYGTFANGPWNPGPGYKTNSYSFEEAKSFTEAPPEFEWPFGPNSSPGREAKWITMPFSQLLHELSPMHLASDFVNKRMTEVLEMLDYDSLEAFSSAVDAYALTKLPLPPEGVNEIEFGDVQIRDTVAPGNNIFAYAYPIIHPYSPEESALRNTTRVRPTLEAIIVYYERSTYVDPNLKTQTVTKSFEEALPEIYASINKDGKVGGSFADVNLTGVDTWGKLVVAMGFFNEESDWSGGESEPVMVKKPQMHTLTMGISEYVNGFMMNTPAGNYQFVYDESGLFDNGNKVDSNLFNEDTPFTMSNYEFKFIYKGYDNPGTGTEPERPGEEGGKKSIKFLKKI